MSNPSPPKPWERAGASAAPAATSASTMASNPSIANAASTVAGSAAAGGPALPARPSTLNTVAARTASNYSPYGANRFGTGMGTTMGTGYGSSYSSGYGGAYGGGYGGGYGGMSSYSSPYSRFGMGSSMYGSYGGMSGMGGMGGMYGGMGGGMYGNGMGDPNDPNNAANGFTNSTQATFQMIESIVGAFGGFAQMLESTYMATHNVFFAMMQVAEQFGNLRTTLGSILGIFTIMRWARTLFAKLTGGPLPADRSALTAGNFAAFEGRPAPPGTRPPPSKKPFLTFLALVFGLPYLMNKMIKHMAKNREEELARQNAAMAPGAEGQPNLEFCRLLFDFTPEAGVENVDLAVKKGDLVAVLSKTDPMGNPSEWWRCRARDGRVGYLPSPYLEVIKRGQPVKALPAPEGDGSRTASLTGSRTNTLVSDSAPNLVSEKKPDIKSKVGDIGVDSFQKTQFYSN